MKKAEYQSSPMQTNRIFSSSRTSDGDPTFQTNSLSELSGDLNQNGKRLQEYNIAHVSKRSNSYRLINHHIRVIINQSVLRVTRVE